MRLDEGLREVRDEMDGADLRARDCGVGGSEGTILSTAAMTRIDDDEPVLLLRRRKPDAAGRTPQDDDPRTRVRARTPVGPAPSAQRDDDATRVLATRPPVREPLTVAGPVPSDSLTKRTSRSELLDRALGRASRSSSSSEAVTRIADAAALLADPATRRGSRELEPPSPRREGAPLAETVVAAVAPAERADKPARKGSRLPPRVAPPASAPGPAAAAAPTSAPAAAPPHRSRRASYRKAAPSRGPETILASVELAGRRPRPPAPSSTVAIALVKLAGDEGYVLRYLGPAGHVLVERRFADGEVARMYAMHEQDIRPRHWVER